EQALLHRNDVLELVQEPEVDAGLPRQRDEIGAAPNRSHNRPKPLVRRVHGALAVAVLPRRLLPQQRAAADLQRTYGFLQSALERAVDCHDLAGGFHLRTKRPVPELELIEGPA